MVLVGHSYGCYLVNRLASSHKARDKVAAVVLIGAGYPVAGYNRLRWIFYLPLFVRSLSIHILIFMPGLQPLRCQNADFNLLSF